MHSAQSQKSTPRNSMSKSSKAHSAARVIFASQPVPQRVEAVISSLPLQRFDFVRFLATVSTSVFGAFLLLLYYFGTSSTHSELRTECCLLLAFISSMRRANSASENSTSTGSGGGGFVARPYSAGQQRSRYH